MKHKHAIPRPDLDKATGLKGIHSTETTVRYIDRDGKLHVADIPGCRAFYSKGPAASLFDREISACRAFGAEAMNLMQTHEEIAEAVGKVYALAKELGLSPMKLFWDNDDPERAGGSICDLVEDVGDKVTIQCGLTFKPTFVAECCWTDDQQNDTKIVYSAAEKGGAA